jgi:hypothetical protein
MKELKYLEKLIKESKVFLKKYEDLLAAEPDNFGAKLIVGNHKRHLDDLESQAAALKATRKESSPSTPERMVASSAS